MEKKTIQDYKIELENDVHLGHKEGWLDEDYADYDLPLFYRSYGSSGGNVYRKTCAADGIDMSRLFFRDHLYWVWFEADGEGEFLHRSLYANGQTQQQCFFKNGKRHGKWKEFYEDGSPMCEFDFQEDFAVGKRKIWPRGGEVIEDEVDERSEHPSYKEEVEENGIKKTIEREFFSDGSVLEECIDNGDRCEARSYYPDGKLEHVVHTRKYVLDDNDGVIPLAEGGCGARITLPDGIEERYYPNGNPWYRAPYKVGLLHGVKTYYYEDGSIESELPYEQGMLHGVLRRYYPDGTLRSETPYRYFKRFGVERTYWQNGALDTSTSYVNDLKHGMQCEYREDGGLRFENPYVKDKLYGCVCDYRHLNGRVFIKAIYIKGVLEGYAYCYDECGKRVCSIEYEQGEAVNAWDKEDNPLDLSLVRGEHPFTDFCMLLYGKELED